MTERVWSREHALALVRPRLWRYLSEAAEVARGHGDVDFGGLAVDELRRLYAAALGVSSETELALDAAAELLRVMPSAAVRARAEFSGQIRGPVDWQATSLRQAVTADPTLFVCSPPERRYDTPLGRLIRLALQGASALQGIAGLRESGFTGRAVAETSARARRMMLHSKMSDVRRIRPQGIRNAAQLVQRRPLAAPLLVLAERYLEGIVHGSETALVRLLEEQYFTPTDDSRLFELLVGFDLLDAASHAGMPAKKPASLLPNAKVPFAELASPVGVTRVWWQKSIWSVAEGAQEKGAWFRVLADNAMSQSPLRPDFIVENATVGLCLLVEVKLTMASESTAERDGIRDVLAYISDAAGLLSEKRTPHGLVVAWNASGVPVNLEVPVLVADQHRLSGIVTDVLRQTFRTAA